MMGLEALLRKHEITIVKKWFDMVVATYPADTSLFLKNQKNPFANPVGNTTLKNLEALFQELLGGMNHDSLVSFLDPIIRMRAVQDFSPSQAVGFILLLKNVIRDQIKKELDDAKMVKALREFETRIDDLSLIAFDVYVGCREKVYQIKANEEKKSTYRAFERAGLLANAEDP
jgi:hypothetical protein